jgi:transcription initiation factor TFIIB
MLDIKHGETICGNCGLVLEENAIDQRREWRYEKLGEPARVGSRGLGPLTNVTKANNLSTLIGFGRDAYHKKISAHKALIMKRLRRLQIIDSSKAPRNMNLKYAFGRISKQVSDLALFPLIKKQSAHLYKRIANKKIMRGQTTIEAMVSASIYAACRQCGVPRTLDEVTVVSKKSRKDIAKAYRILNKELSLNFPPTKPLDYIDRFCSELKLSNRARVYTSDLLLIVEYKEILINYDPSIIAAVAIYRATKFCNEGRTQKEITDVAKITKPSLRNRYRELESKLGELGITVR